MKILLASILVLAAGCSDKKSFEQIPVVGLPCSASGQQLVNPIVMEAKREDGTLRMTYHGTMSGRAVTAEVPKDAETKFEIRFGVCADAQCRDPRWIENTQTVSVDTRLPDATLVVGVPGDHACR